VVGAGIAGLTVATALAQTGWAVSACEKSEVLREDGSAIFLWENGLRALERIGAYEEAVADGTQLTFWESVDERLRRLQSDTPSDRARVYCVRRDSLHEALVHAAIAAGVTIHTGFVAASATRAGEVRYRNGEVHHADVVVGADGFESAVRTSLGLARSTRVLSSRARRLLIPRAQEDPDTINIEYWSGSRRLGVTPCGVDRTYVYLFCRIDDEVGGSVPLDRRSWIASFPQVPTVIERVPANEPWRSIGEVSCSSWVAGRTVLLGDAAHAMAPNLGQGACAAMQSALQLVDCLQEDSRPEAAFARWEASRKPMVERVQRASRVYDHLLTRWPQSLLDVRSAVAWAIPRSKTMRRIMTGTAQLG
jgi:2-polyprenyl-6-methoxyphenol hydroxylase-like FAD-dependent oxidoreductase